MNYVLVVHVLVLSISSSSIKDPGKSKYVVLCISIACITPPTLAMVHR